MSTDLKYIGKNYFILTSLSTHQLPHQSCYQPFMNQRCLENLSSLDLQVALQRKKHYTKELLMFVRVYVTWDLIGISKSFKLYRASEVLEPVGSLSFFFFLLGTFLCL